MVAISRNKLVYLTINKCNNDFIDDNDDIHSVGTAQLFFKYFITYELPHQPTTCSLTITNS